VIGFAQFLLAVAGVLFAVGVLLLLVVTRLEARATSANAKSAAAREAHRALRARLGA
jgi:hypothetical protein